jgi:hypothetical protein
MDKREFVAELESIMKRIECLRDDVTVVASKRNEYGVKATLGAAKSQLRALVNMIWSGECERQDDQSEL